MLAPLAIGAVLVALVYAGAHVSGAHYNPAVSLALLLRGSARPGEMTAYAATQVVAAALAAPLVRYLAGSAPEPLAVAVGPALAAEALFTFALVFVILNVATARGVEDNSYFGLAIGSTVMAGVYAVGGVSGAVFNPAVGVGLAALGVLETGTLALYAAVQLLAGAGAAALFGTLDLGRDKPTTATPAEQAALRPQAEP